MGASASGPRPRTRRLPTGSSSRSAPTWDLGSGIAVGVAAKATFGIAAKTPVRVAAAIMARFTPESDPLVVSRVGGRFVVQVGPQMTIATDIRNHSCLSPGITVSEAAELVLHITSGTVPGTVPMVIPRAPLRTLPAAHKAQSFNILHRNWTRWHMRCPIHPGWTALWRRENRRVTRSLQPASAGR